MGSSFEWQLSLALALPVLIPVLGTLLIVNILARRRLRAEAVKLAAMYSVTRGRRR